jgi:hypothetical protein
MLRLNAYKDNPLAHRTYVSRVGSIYLVDDGLIQVTFVTDVPNSRGKFVTMAQAHLISKPEQWRDIKRTFGFTMEALTNGLLTDGRHLVQ